MTKKTKIVLVTVPIILSWVLLTIAYTDLSQHALVTPVIYLYIVLLVIAALALFVAGAAGVKRRRGVRFMSVAVILLYIVSFWVVADAICESTLEESKERGNELVAAIEEYRADHFVYPRNLAILIPEYLDSLPTARVGLFLDLPYWYNANDSVFSLVFPVPAWMFCSYDSRRGDWKFD